MNTGKKEFVVMVYNDFSFDVNPSQLNSDGSLSVPVNGRLEFISDDFNAVTKYKILVMKAKTREIIYESTSNPERGWSGIDNNGNQVPKGDYYIVVFAGDEQGNSINPIKKRVYLR